jgi:chloramphenicol O-acetyltransferase type A
MRSIDMETWPRRRHFDFFNGMDYPQFNLCANVDITAFRTIIRQRRLSLSISLSYLIAKVANDIPEFRYRIRGQQVIEHEVVHPSSTQMTDGDLFALCLMPYDKNYTVFAGNAAAAIEKVNNQPALEDPPGQDDLLFLSAIPWVTFTSITHTIHFHPVDSTPRLSWGKYFYDGERLKMPFSIQVHHALMDGVHVGRYFAHFQDCLDHFEQLL